MWSRRKNRKSSEDPRIVQEKERETVLETLDETPVEISSDKFKILKKSGRKRIKVLYDEVQEPNFKEGEPLFDESPKILQIEDLEKLLSGFAKLALSEKTKKT